MADLKKVRGGPKKVRSGIFGSAATHTSTHTSTTTSTRTVQQLYKGGIGLLKQYTIGVIKNSRSDKVCRMTPYPRRSAENKQNICHAKINLDAIFYNIII